jgi:hypothetical protein
VHLLRNALICASTVLECNCCRIHRYVAAPNNHKNTTGLKKHTEQEEEPAGLIPACSAMATVGGGGGEGGGGRGRGGTVQFSPTNGLCMMGGARTCSAPS